jgi:phosphatidylserine/phosphatidylglycerophosphate/cardiolipin synthase-like enzyme
MAGRWLGRRQIRTRLKGPTLKLLVQPNDGVAPLLAGIKSAKKSIDILIFRMDWKELETALKVASGQGIAVRALIAHTNRGGEPKLRNLETRFLEAGITVGRTADDLIRYHGKMMIVDRRMLFLLSFNFVHMDIDHSRGFGIVTRNTKMVQEAVKLSDRSQPPDIYRGLNARRESNAANSSSRSLSRPEATTNYDPDRRPADHESARKTCKGGPRPVIGSIAALAARTCP